MGENISLAFQGIWNHKLRSFFDDAWHHHRIASIITIVSTIKGPRTDQEQSHRCRDGYVNVQLVPGG